MVLLYYTHFSKVYARALGLLHYFCCTYYLDTPEQSDLERCYLFGIGVFVPFTGEEIGGTLGWEANSSRL